MGKRELTEEERTALRQALHRATSTLRTTLYGELMEQYDREHPGDPLGFPAGHGLAELATLRHAIDELEVMAQSAARSAGADGASYADLGVAWGGISRQAARKKWPGAVTAPPSREPVEVVAFGGHARVSWQEEPGGWWWIAEAADGQHGDAGNDVTYDSSEEAAATAGAFLAAHQAPGEV